jgi:hypothetical protein
MEDLEEYPDLMSDDEFEQFKTDRTTLADDIWSNVHNISLSYFNNLERNLEKTLLSNTGFSSTHVRI